LLSQAYYDPNGLRLKPKYDVEKGWEIATSLAGFYGNKPILLKIFVVTRN
jgi:hypothetical protein